jgi:DNA polymerase-3 subunit beta
LDICRALPGNAELTLEGSGSKAKIASGRSRFSLAAMSADEFPSIGAFDASIELVLDQEVLADLLESTSFAMAHQDVRYYLNGLLLEVEANRLRAVATDGHRLALTDKVIDASIAAPRQCIVPRKGVLEIGRLLGHGSGKVRLSIGDNHLRVAAENQSLTTKLVDGRFPDYERVIPRQTDHCLVGDRESLRAGLSRASILSNEKFRGIRLILKKNLLTAVAHNPEQEEAQEEIEVQYNGSAMEVGFNVSYLLDVLGVLRSDAVRLDLLDANSSCLLQASEGAGSRYVVMPMRL